MRNFIAIALCMVFVVMSADVFGQIKPTKKPKDMNTNAKLNKKPASNSITGQTASKESCWEITGKTNGDKEFRWDTEANVQSWIEEMRAQHNELYSYEPCGNPTVESCDANNEKVQPKKCWKITATKGGQSIEQYMWSTETVARRKAASLRSNGYQNAKYVQTSANDEKYCGQPENDPNEPSCWEIKIGNVVTLLWGYERDAQAAVEEARNSGHTATYELSPDKTKITCQ